MNTDQKKCFKCDTAKPLDEFYRHRRMADGHLNKCKDCTKADVRRRRFDPKYRPAVLEYDRRRGNRQDSEYRNTVRSRDRRADRARNMVNNAVRDGRLLRPDRCSHCHTVGMVHGHHHDYSRPLDVVWLCVPCHRQLHAFMDTVEKSMGHGAF